MAKESVYSAHRCDDDYSVTRVSDNEVPVTAAGCIVWRYKHERLETLIIHRPRYDDWSWPKGKQDSGETIAETAIREVREEVGLDVTLGVPLARTEYPVKRKTKHVYYWAAEVSAATKPHADMGEVDELRWVTPEQAFTMLTNETDQEPLEALVRLWEQKDLATRSLVVIRHAKAKPRSTWTAAEGERPLAATGKRQALSVCRLLQAWAPQKIYSSPWKRCMQTVAAYTKNTGITIKEKSSLTEDSHHRHPKRVVRFVESLFDKEYPVALCTHRPVLPTVVEVFAKSVPQSIAKNFPSRDPRLELGELLVLHISKLRPTRIVSWERIRSFDD
ncbi:NUDIX hydrolase [Rothia sp. P7181]|uniref:NUDIX hydrolase n=1 Tax=unclassified Rothia (in: high G+C Gram-positive bacteria) TaxID=2689056 RepID=UPI003AC5FF1C